MLKKKLLILLAALCCVMGAVANDAATANLSLNKDTLSTHSLDAKITSAIGLGLGASGILSWTFGKDNSGHLEGGYFPKKNETVADVLCFAPKVLQWGMRLSGIDGKYERLRSVTNEIIGITTMYAVTTSIKNIIHRSRPNGEDNHSFPSRHTATAFLSAAMLDENYGHLSPFIPLGGYALSTMVGFERVRTNKHYTSDALTGAAIGILSARLAYFLGDILFKGKGIIHQEKKQHLEFSEKPLFIGFYGGISIPLSNYKGCTAIEPALTEGLESSLLLSKRFGIMGRIGQSHYTLRKQNGQTPVWCDILNMNLGVTFNILKSDRVMLESHLLGGYATQIGGRNELRAVNIRTLEGFQSQEGIGTHILLRPSLSLNGSIDCTNLWSKKSLTFLQSTIGLSYTFQ